MGSPMLRAVLFGTACVLVSAVPASGLQADRPDPMDPAVMPDDGPERGWRLSATGQAFPILSVGLPSEKGSPLRETGVYVTQPTVMGRLWSPGSRAVLRLTLNFEGVTQEKGELNFGGWGEGFIEKRHPHTLLHEGMLSINFPAVGSGSASISVGRGFAPYGTDDPMSRPGIKFPTNHHLSQILERWAASGLYLWGDWSVEAGLFAGAEPEGPYDLSNTRGFGKSWSARLVRRWRPMVGDELWETAASYASVLEYHGGETERSDLANVFVRYEGSREWGHLYGLAEASVGGPNDASPYRSFLVEFGLEARPHLPWIRIEQATRPEYPRADPSGGEGFFRYDLDAEAEGTTRWLIVDLGYAFLASTGAVSVRPFLDLQLHRVAHERGPPSSVPSALSGGGSLWMVTVGARIFFGGGPMRMGSYGLLDAMAEPAMDPGMNMP